MAELPIAAAGNTDPGQARQRNEDNLFVLQQNGAVDPGLIAGNGCLYVVADGVGGNAGGARASEIAVTSIPGAFYAEVTTEVAQNLRRAFDVTARQIVNEANTNADRSNMSCTVVAAAILGPTATIAHLGDARAYLLRDGQLQRLTRDDTWVQDQVETGTLTPAEASTHPERNVITKSMGGAALPAPTLRQIQVQDGDRLLLCSDGLSEVVGDPAMQSILNSTRDLNVAVGKLISAANQNGGPDNITALVIQVGQPVMAAAGKKRAPVLMALIVLAGLLLGGWLILQSRGAEASISVVASPSIGAPIDAQASVLEATPTLNALPGGVEGADPATSTVAAGTIIGVTGTAEGGVIVEPVVAQETQSVQSASTAVTVVPSNRGPVPELRNNRCDVDPIAQYPGNRPIPFQWRWDGQLTGDQYLEVRINDQPMGRTPPPTSSAGEWQAFIPPTGFLEQGLSNYRWAVYYMNDPSTTIAFSSEGCFAISGSGNSSDDQPTASPAAPAPAPPSPSPPPPLPPTSEPTTAPPQPPTSTPTPSPTEEKPTPGPTESPTPS